MLDMVKVSHGDIHYADRTNATLEDIEADELVSSQNDDEIRQTNLVVTADVRRYGCGTVNFKFKVDSLVEVGVSKLSRVQSCTLVKCTL